MKIPFVTACAGLVLVALLANAAARAAEPPAKADACRACHGRDGVSAAPDIPNLAGQRRDYLVKQLQAFRDGTRENELMQPIAKQLADADIAALAAYWSGLSGGAGNATQGAAHPATVSAMTLPADFPAGFVEYGREQDEASKGISVKYANAAAVAAARAGRPLPDGSAIVVAFFAARLDAAGKPVTGADGRFVIDKVRSYSGMETRAGWGNDIPDLLRNGGWLYGIWAADGSSRLGANQPRCLACHKAKAADSYVFTLDALKRAPAR